MNSETEVPRTALCEIFSSGGGTQSACIAALIVQGRLPRPDYVCIVDTEHETRTTWEYLDSVIRPALRAVGLEVHRIRKSVWGSKPPHGLDYLSHNGNSILLPGYSNLNGKHGKIGGFCSKTWKVETQQRYVRKVLGISTKQQRRWIGFSTDEYRRYSRMALSPDGIAGLVRFPLIEDVPLSRAQAIEEVLGMGWPMPPKSACYMCPNHTDEQWRDSKENRPDEFRQSVEWDRKLRKKDPAFFVHQSCVPLDEVDFTKKRAAPETCNSGGCFT